MVHLHNLPITVCCRHLILALKAWAWYTTAHQIATSFLGMDTRMTSQLFVPLIYKLRGSFMCLANCLTCYQWVFLQPCTGRQPVDLQELNVYTVGLHISWISTADGLLCMDLHEFYRSVLLVSVRRTEVKRYMKWRLNTEKEKYYFVNVTSQTTQAWKVSNG